MKMIREETEKRVRCNLCGFEEVITGMEMGVIDDGNVLREFYGNHSCPNGGMGTLYLVGEVNNINND